MTKVWRSGISLAHKPVGVTSHAIVRGVLEEVRSQNLKVCHGGTLDPFAEGLLLLLVGHATRLQERLHALPKTYEATLRWGIETDTGDLHGRVMSESTHRPEPTTLEKALDAHRGWTAQVPPATSAKKIQGEPAYKRAHRGETVELPPSNVYLHDAEWTAHEGDHSRLKLVVRGGFYVRSLANELGRALGCGAHLTELRRTQIGPWSDSPGETISNVHSGQESLSWLPTRPLSTQEYRVLKDRKEIPLGTILPPKWRWPDKFPQPNEEAAGLLDNKVVFLLKKASPSTWVSAELFIAGF
jgi:tRNA pseudouridine55 synthase